MSQRRGGTRDQPRHARALHEHNALPEGSRARTSVPTGGRYDGGACPRHRPPLAVPARRQALSGGCGWTPARSNPQLGPECQTRLGAGRCRLDVPSGVEGGCQRSRVEGRPAPPAGQRPSRCQQARLGRAVGHCPGRRARSCRPSPPACPGRPSALASPNGFHTWRLATRLPRI
jgi:hypothetical protein